MNIIPKNIMISTMTITCYLGTPFILKNVYDYL